MLFFIITMELFVCRLSNAHQIYVINPQRNYKYESLLGRKENKKICNKINFDINATYVLYLQQSNLFPYKYLTGRLKIPIMKAATFSRSARRNVPCAELDSALYYSV